MSRRVHKSRTNYNSSVVVQTGTRRRATVWNGFEPASSELRDVARHVVKYKQFTLHNIVHAKWVSPVRVDYYREWTTRKMVPIKDELAQYLKKIYVRTLQNRKEKEETEQQIY